jgi:hypothetical protein
MNRFLWAFQFPVRRENWFSVLLVPTVLFVILGILYWVAWFLAVVSMGNSLFPQLSQNIPSDPKTADLGYLFELYGELIKYQTRQTLIISLIHFVLSFPVSVLLGGYWWMMVGALVQQGPNATLPSWVDDFPKIIWAGLKVLTFFTGLNLLAGLFVAGLIYLGTGLILFITEPESVTLTHWGSQFLENFELMFIPVFLLFSGFYLLLGWVFETAYVVNAPQQSFTGLFQVDRYWGTALKIVPRYFVFITLVIVGFVVLGFILNILICCTFYTILLITPIFYAYLIAVYMAAKLWMFEELIPSIKRSDNQGNNLKPETP